MKLKQNQVPVVFVEISTTGRLGGSATMALHEVVLCRLKLRMTSESVLIEKKAWPDWAAPQVQVRSVRDEYARLVRDYSKELVEEVYGMSHMGRLQAVMLRMGDAHAKGVSPEDIVKLGRPESDFAEFEEGTSGDDDGRVEDEDDDRPGSASDAADQVLPPTGMAPLGSGDDEDEDEIKVDGNLIEFLEEQGWNNVQAGKLARLVGVKGFDEISDTDVRDAIGINKEDARRKAREHLAEFQGRKAQSAKTAKAAAKKTVKKKPTARAPSA